MRDLKGKNARLITAVVVVYNHDQQNVTNIAAGASASASAKIVGATSDPTISISGHHNRTKEIKIKDGYNIGYEMSAPVWQNGELVGFKVDKIGWGG